MAGTSVLKLKVDDREYVASLKSAKQGMQDLQQSLQSAGKTFSDVDGKIVEYAKALGDMNTTSKTARGQINEMTQAFVELSKVYGQMTDQEKQSPLGKGLAESLERLKQRTIDSKNELGNLTRQLEPAKNGAESTGGAINMLKDKLMLNIDAMKLFSVGLQAAKAALDVAKDAFFASEANMDEWGRVMKSSQALYEGFLYALNNGDISGYLSNMSEIVRAAREAYNAMDTLQTMKTIQSPQFSKQEAENNRFRLMIQTGRWISAGDGRRSPLGLKDGDLLSPTQIKALERQLQNGMTTIVSLTKNELKQTGVAIDKYYNSLAKQNGISLKEFREGTSSWNAFSQKIAGYEAYKEWDRNARAEFARQGGQGFMNFDKNNPYAEYRKWGTFRVDKMGENSYNELVGLIKQQQSQQSQMYSTIGQAYRTVNRAEGITVRGLMGGGSGGRGGGGGGIGTEVTYAADSIAAMEKRVQELTKKWREAGAAVRDDYKAQLDEAKKELAIMQNPGKAVNTAGLVGLAGASISSVGGTMNIPDNLDIKAPLEKMNENLNRLIALRDNAMTSGEYQVYAKAVKSQEGDIAKFKGEGANGNKIVNDIGKVTEQMGQITGGIGDITGGLEQLGVEIPEGINKAVSAIQAVSTILTGIAAIVTLIKGEQTVQTTASWVDALIPFSHGGVVRAAGGYVVPGNFGYDAVPSLLTSGEVVLNKAQQGVLASMLSDNGGGRGYTPSHVSGEQIWIALNAFTKRTGRGELVTWR